MLHTVLSLVYFSNPYNSNTNLLSIHFMQRDKANKLNCVQRCHQTAKGVSTEVISCLYFCCNIFLSSTLSKIQVLAGGGPSYLSNSNYKSPILKKARMEADR
jgi:hypothetical protein